MLSVTSNRMEPADMLARLMGDMARVKEVSSVPGVLVRDKWLPALRELLPQFKQLYPHPSDRTPLVILTLVTFHKVDDLEVATELLNLVMTLVLSGKDATSWLQVVHLVSLTLDPTTAHDGASMDADRVYKLASAIMSERVMRENPRLQHLGTCCAHLYRCLSNTRFAGAPCMRGWRFVDWSFGRDGNDVLVTPFQLGKGAFGRVFLAFGPDPNPDFQAMCKPGQPFFRHMNSLVPIAVKESPKEPLLDEARNLWRHRDHHVVRLLRQPEQQEEHPLFMVMELVDGTIQDESAVVHGSGDWDEDRLRDYAGALLEALSELHARKMTHRDLKPDNVGIVRSFSCDDHCCMHACLRCPPYCAAPKGDRVCVKLLDFGFGVEADLASSVKGSPYYMAPELLCQGNPAGPRAPPTPTDPKKSDVWSMALVILYLACNRLPVPTARNWTHLLGLVCSEATSGRSGTVNASTLLDLPSGLSCPLPQLPWAPSADFVSLMRAMLRLNPKLRFTAAEALNHPWFHPAEAEAVEGNDEGAVEDAVMHSHHHRHHRHHHHSLSPSSSATEAHAATAAATANAGEMDALRDQVRDLQAALEREQAQHRATQAQVEERDRAQSTLESQLAEARSAQQALTDALRELRLSVVERATSVLPALSADARAGEDDAACLGAVQALVSNVQHWQQHSTEAMRTTQEECDRLRQLVETSRTQRAAMERRFAAALAELEEAKTRAQRVEGELQEVRDHRLGQVQERAECAERELAEVRDLSHRQQAEVIALREEELRLGKEVERLRAELESAGDSSLAARLYSCQQRLSDMRGTQERLLSEKEALQRQKNEAQAECRRLKQGRSVPSVAVMEENERLQRRLAEMEETMRQQQRDLDDCRSELVAFQLHMDGG